MIVMTEYTFHATLIIYTHFDKILNIKNEILNIKSLSQVTWLPAKARPFLRWLFHVCTSIGEFRTVEWKKNTNDRIGITEYELVACIWYMHYKQHSRGGLS